MEGLLSTGPTPSSLFNGIFLIVQFSGRVTKSKEEYSQGCIGRPSPRERVMESSDSDKNDICNDPLEIASDSPLHS